MITRDAGSSDEDGRDEVQEEDSQEAVLPPKLYLTTNNVNSRSNTLAYIHLQTYTLESMKEEVEAY